MYLCEKIMSSIYRAGTNARCHLFWDKVTFYGSNERKKLNIAQTHPQLYNAFGDFLVLVCIQIKFSFHALLLCFVDERPSYQSSLIIALLVEFCTPAISFRTKNGRYIFSLFEGHTEKLLTLWTSRTQRRHYLEFLTQHMAFRNSTLSY